MGYRTVTGGVAIKKVPYPSILKNRSPVGSNKKNSFPWWLGVIKSWIINKP
jgi:hypothetical protein